MTTVRQYVEQLYNNTMIVTQASTGLPAGQIATAATMSTSQSTVVMAITVPTWVVAGMNAYDVTKTTQTGVVAGSTSTTLTLSANSSHTVGSGDVLQFGFTPSDLSTGAGDGADIQGLVKSVILHMEEAYAILNYLETDIITSAQDSTANTSLSNAAALL